MVVDEVCTEQSTTAACNRFDIAVLHGAPSALPLCSLLSIMGCLGSCHRLGLLCCLLAVLASNTYLVQARGQSKPVPMQLTQQPGCGGPSTDLPAGLTDQCTLELKDLTPSDSKLIGFSIPKGSQMSLSISMRSRGGVAEMGLYAPGNSTDGPPSYTPLELYHYASEQEWWIYVDPATLNKRPGDYVLRVKGVSGTASASINFYTPGRAMRLAEVDVQALQQLANTCCSQDTQSTFCTTVAPRALSLGRSWQEDLCHLPPNRCNSRGRLTHLVLAGMGLRCASFPEAVMGLEGLERLDLSNNDLGAASFYDMANTLRANKGLKELYLSRTQLSGELMCLDQFSTRDRLDVSNNALAGPMKACLLAAPFKELFLGGNRLTGDIPEVSVTTGVSVLYASGQQGVGFTGTIPPSLLLNPAIRELDLGANNLTGSLPPLGRSRLTYLNVSRNSLSGGIGGLPRDAWAVDISSNMFTGEMPQLNGLTQLTAFIASNNLLSGSIGLLPESLQQLEVANNALSGPLPRLPGSMVRMDIANNALEGDISEVDLSTFEDFRAANNSLTGNVPSSAARAKDLYMLSLRHNKLIGSLPRAWDTPALQYLLLQDNQLTGTLPASLANQPKLGVLRLQKNQLKGNLNAFASAIPEGSQLFDFNISANQLTGGIPDALSKLGVFNGSTTILLPQKDGTADKPIRFMDLSDNSLSGPWPLWVLQSVPDTRQACECTVFVALNGEAMRLTCPAPTNVSDYGFQVASETQYYCWNGQAQVPIIDILGSPSNSLQAGDGGWRPPGDSPGGKKWMPGADKGLSPGASAGVAFAAIFVVGAAVWTGLVLRKRALDKRNGQFEKYMDEAAVGITADGRHKTLDEMLKEGEAAAMAGPTKPVAI